MNEKTECYCGKTLEVFTPMPRSNQGEYLGCPVHGEDWRLTQEQVIALVKAVRAWETHVDQLHREKCMLPMGLVVALNQGLAALPKGEDRG